MDDFAAYAHFYDLDYADQRADITMIRQFAAHHGSPILDLGCGTGRVLVPLARDGYTVTGVDTSPAMLDLARRKVEAEALQDRAHLLQQDLRGLDVVAGFALAFCASNTFMSLPSTPEQLEVLERIHQSLKPGGLLVIDLFNPDPQRLADGLGQVTLEKVMTDPESGHQLMKFRAQTVDLALQLIHVTLYIDELHGDGRLRRTLFPFSLRYLFPGELDLLLQRAGFALDALYGSYELDPFDAESDKLIAVARRQD